jgi:hypothetical protein
MKRFISIVVAVAAILAAPALLFGWGDAGHRLTGEAAALKMPAAMPAFLRDAVHQLAYMNPDPDRWKDRAERTLDPALDGGTSQDHFIDMELVPPAVLAAALKAPDRWAYSDTLAEAHVRAATMGFLPFRTLEMAQRLRVEFRLWRAAPDSTRPWIEARIVNDAGILGHYVADGSQPLHTTVQYNGWTGPNPNGYATDKRLHARFESNYVSANIALADVLARVDSTPRVFPDLRAAIVAYLRESNAQVEHLYQLDKAHPFEATEADPADKAFVSERLAAGARMLRDLWWTAYVTSAPGATR